MDKINVKVSALPVKSLKEMAVALFKDSRDGSEIVLSAVLTALEAKMSEADFVAFCDAI